MKYLNKNSVLKIFWGLIIFSIFSACQSGTGKQVVKIRGKLINPQTDEIYISRDIFMINADTLKLVGENKVKAFVNVPKEGLYLFFVFPEFQTIYLKPGDSLSFHINVEEFDESLSFSGNLGSENNLLMDLFLENERESNYFYQSHFNFQPQEFLKKIDSFNLKKEKIMTNYYQNFDLSNEKFKAIAKLMSQSIDYNLKEIYPLKKKGIELPEHYYDFEQVFKHPLADPNIFYMYYFANSFISRKIDKNITKDRLNIERARQIQKNIVDPAFKDNLLMQFCSSFIKKNHIYKQNKTIETYYKFIKNEKYKDFCNRLMKKNSLLKKGQDFPSIAVWDKHHKTYLTDSILKNKKVCLSFWDLKLRKNFTSNLHKLKALKNQFPDIEFIIININPDNFDQWLLAIPETDEFKFFKVKNKADIFKISPYHLSQVYLVNDRIINECFENMYLPGFVKNMSEFDREK